MSSSVLSITTPQQLADWTRDTRQRTLELIADLDDQQIIGPPLDTVNQPLWEIGHHAWFFSYWVLRHACGQAPLRDDEDALYDSIAIAHDSRWQLALPSRQETLDYLSQVLDRVVAQLAPDDLTEEVAYHVLYSILHEDMHTEAHTYTRQTLGYPAPTLAIAPATNPVLGGGPLRGDVTIPGGSYMLGATADEPFVFDNEKWAHPVDIAPFAIARAPVTQAEFAAFVDAGGYFCRELWDEEGWTWCQDNGATHPVYWRRQNDGWQRRHFDQWGPLEEHLPVIHVSCYEAQAYCRWAGRRLPSEAEWEVAAIGQPNPDGSLSQHKRSYPWGESAPDPQRANLDWQAMGCLEVGALPAGDSAFGCRQMVGNLWEWANDAFLPFPGFEVDPYKEYSEPWFGTRKVMRGGCWTTRSRLIRTRYRNFQTPDRRDVWVGFRTCALLP